MFIVINFLLAGVLFSLNLDFIVNKISKLLKLLDPFQEIKNGQELFSQIVSFNPMNNKIEFCAYKFYDNLLFRVISSSKSLGTPIIPIFAKIKKAILSDIKVEKEIVKLKINSQMMFIGAGVLTWLFSFFSMKMLNLSLPFFEMGLLFIWQILGFITFPWVLNIFIKLKLKNYKELIEKIYIFDLSLMAQMPMLEVLKQANFSSLKLKESHRLYFYLQRLLNLVELRQRSGQQINSDIELLIEDIWSTYQMDCEALKTQVSIIKFVWMSLFYLSTYLLSLYFILGRLI